MSFLVNKNEYINKVEVKSGNIIFIFALKKMLIMLIFCKAQTSRDQTTESLQETSAAS